MFEKKLLDLEPLFDAIDESYGDRGDFHEFDKVLLNFLLVSHTGKQREVADTLNVSVRTIRNKINEFGLKRPVRKVDEVDGPETPPEIA